IVMIAGGSGDSNGGALYYQQAVAGNADFKIANTAGGGINCLGAVEGAPGNVMGTTDDTLTFVVADRNPGTLDIYSTDSRTDSVEASRTYHADGLDQSYTGDVIDAVGRGQFNAIGFSQCSGWAMAFFPNNSLPDHEALMAAFDQMNAAYKVGNFLLPSGWSRRFSL
ncbi:MAG: hypothetical protein KJO69_09690, partial [Gammaproteobacteria bacterium]|nr:hypothetical protein [Gammaproteobacteria bacterium]